ncbi:MAG: transposase [Bacteroidetes bacterium]|nr:transposase [Bacteroidota bacterium]
MATLHHRRSIRLRNYDYTQNGAYFVTICVQDRVCLLGDVADGEMRLNAAGQIVQDVWYGLPDHYPHVQLDAWVIMPNHVHGIIVLVDAPVGAGFKPAPTGASTTRHGLPEIVRALKTFSSRQINVLRGTPGTKLWQRNYWERIIRDEPEHHRIRAYIRENPSQWERDRLHPQRTSRNP